MHLTAASEVESNRYSPRRETRSRALWRAARAVALALLVLVLAVLLAVPVGHADEVATALYVRSDTDHTTVVSPRVRVAKQLSETTRVDATYSADIWTSASIDIRTSASVRPVTEQRDELNLAVSHDFEDVTLHAGYRFSTEHDYTSHGLILGGAYDFADNAAKLEVGARVIGDTVGQSGNPAFARSVTNLDANVSLTQVLDPMMIAQLTYEPAYAHGYQSSPYRVVGAGGSGYGCVGASLCLPERVPTQRVRHAFALLLRRAFSDAVSFGLTYRYYIDDWSLGSHTLLGELGWNVSASTLLMLRYRFYTQGAVSFYKPIYATLANSDYRTRDRELSGMTYHRAGAELEHDFLLDERGTKLAATLAVSGNLYRYADFVGLDQILALEISVALMLKI